MINPEGIIRRVGMSTLGQDCDMIKAIAIYVEVETINILVLARCSVKTEKHNWIPGSIPCRTMDKLASTRERLFYGNLTSLWIGKCGTRWLLLAIERYFYMPKNQTAFHWSTRSNRKYSRLDYHGTASFSWLTSTQRFQGGWCSWRWYVQIPQDIPIEKRIRLIFQRTVTHS